MSAKQDRPPFHFGPAKLLLGTVCGLVGFVGTVYMLVLGLQVQGWTESKATIRQADLVTGYKGKKSLSVAYDYAFAGRQYTGTRVGFVSGGSVEARKEKFAVGNLVACYVNPKQPEQAVLSRQISWANWVLPVFFLGLGLCLGYATRKTIIWCRQRAEPRLNPALEPVTT